MRGSSRFLLTTSRGGAAGVSVPNKASMSSFYRVFLRPPRYRATPASLSSVDAVADFLCMLPLVLWPHHSTWCGEERSTPFLGGYTFGVPALLQGGGNDCHLFSGSVRSSALLQCFEVLLVHQRIFSIRTFLALPQCVKNWRRTCQSDQDYRGGLLLQEVPSLESRTDVLEAPAYIT